jgi:hypothetical protein
MTTKVEAVTIGKVSITLAIFLTIAFLASPVSAQSLERLIRQSDAVVQAHVTTITSDVDQYNAPLQLVTLQIDEVNRPGFRGGLVSKWIYDSMIRKRLVHPHGGGHLRNR